MMKLRSFNKDKLFELLKDSLLKESIFWQNSESRGYPNTDDLVKSNERDEMVAYLLEVCDREDMSLSVETFALCVTLLDRFLASFKVKSKYLECLAVACLYIACKVKEEDDNLSITSEFLIDCDCKCSIAELLRMEQMILSKFEWSVNDITASDFIYLYYAILVDKYRSTASMAMSTNSPNNKWNRNNVNNKIKTNKSESDYYPPADLDFLHTLEYKLKQCLCVSDISANFRPHCIALSLISMQLEANKIEQVELMNLLTFHSKLNHSQIENCKEKIKVHLSSIESSKTLFDLYFDENIFDKSRKRFFYVPPLALPSTFASPSASMSTNLTAIIEEDEDQDENAIDQKSKSILKLRDTNQFAYNTHSYDKLNELKQEENKNSGFYKNIHFSSDSLLVKHERMLAKEHFQFIDYENRLS